MVSTGPKARMACWKLSYWSAIPVSSQQDEAPARGIAADDAALAGDAQRAGAPSGDSQSRDSQASDAQSGDPWSGAAQSGQAQPLTGAEPAAGSRQPPGFGRAARPGEFSPGGQKDPWKVAEGGKTVFRRGTPVVIWWVWVAFAVFNIFDVVIPGHDYFSLELLAGLLAVTGGAYACGLRPKVVADSDGVFIRNPFRDHRVQWGAVTGVYLGDSIEFSCTRQAPKKDKTIYCWSLYTGRRSRMRSQTQRSLFSLRRPDRRAPAEPADASRRDIVPIMAAELGRRATEARTLGAPPAVLQSRWAWLPLAATLLPAAVLVVLLLAR